MEKGKNYSVTDAVRVVKQFQDSRYDETVALDLQLGIRPEQTEEMVRGIISLPH